MHITSSIVRKIHCKKGFQSSEKKVSSFSFFNIYCNGIITNLLSILFVACMHTDELWYMFYMSIIGNNYKDGTDDAIVSNYFTKMWTNFAKYGYNHSFDIKLLFQKLLFNICCYSIFLIFQRSNSRRFRFNKMGKIQ